MVSVEENGCQSTVCSVDSPGIQGCSSVPTDITEVYKQAFVFSNNLNKLCFPSSVTDVQIDRQFNWISRETFLVAALRSVARIRSALGGKSLQGARIAHYMSANRIEDALLRLAAALTGYSVVTINWDADSFERVKYKVIETKCTAVFYDEFVPKERIDRIISELAQHEIQVMPANALALQADLLVEPGAVDLDSEFEALKRDYSSSASEDARPLSEQQRLTGTSERMISPMPARLHPRSDSLLTWLNQSGLHVLGALRNLETACQCVLDAVKAEHEMPIDFVLVNPFHHVNTSVLFETALRYPTARIYLIDRLDHSCIFPEQLVLRSGGTTTHRTTTSFKPLEDFQMRYLLPSVRISMQGVGLSMLCGPSLLRYRTTYWKVLCLAAKAAAAEARKQKSGMATEVATDFRVVAPLVSRHIDFLQSLSSSDRFNDDGFLGKLREALEPRGVILFLGSAPVGPSTVNNMKRLLGKMPKVRFGSTETSLQVAAIPFSMSDADELKALERGWAHTFAGAQKTGFYIGRPHTSFTEMRVVRSVDAKDEAFMCDCEEGEPGFLVSRSSSSMIGYANTTALPFSQDGWYLGFGDVAFFLVNETDGCRDYYWVSRAADILIKGGANYSCQQISNDLLDLLCSSFSLPKDSTYVATIGIKWRSEHEDDTCVTIEIPAECQSIKPRIEGEFIKTASASLYKAFRPDFVRVATIPKTFKGAVDTGALRKSYVEYLEENAGECK